MRFQKMPSRKTEMIGGAIYACTDCRYSYNTPDIFCIMGIHRIPNITMTAVAIRPTINNFFSGASGCNFLYTSTVNKVEQELKTDASELISAANNPAATSPRMPLGILSISNAAKAWSGVSQLNSPL